MRNTERLNTGCLVLIALAFVAWGVLNKVNHRSKSSSPPTASPLKPVNEEIAMPARTPLRDGLAIVVLVDTSGSMAEKVSTGNGGQKRKNRNREIGDPQDAR